MAGHYRNKRDTYIIIDDNGKIVEKVRLKATATQLKNQLKSRIGGEYTIELIKSLGNLNLKRTLKW